MCGELAGRPIEALALMSIGMTRLSMSPPSIGPIKEMVLALELEPIRKSVAAALSEGAEGVAIRALLETGRAGSAGGLDDSTTWPTFPSTSSMRCKKRFQSVEAALSAALGRKIRPASARNTPSSSRWCRRSSPTARRWPTSKRRRAARRRRQEMRRDGRAEIRELKPRIEKLVDEIRILLLPKDAADEKSVILEVRAGTGGDEAALFAGDLFRMYQRYAELQGWKFALIEESPGEVGGYKEVVANIAGKGVFARLKFECGVHRVQRVPATEAQGRIHTSAATVAVLPEVEDVDIEIRPRTSGSTPCAPPAPAASTSTPPTRRCASPICRPASWSPARKRASTRTARPAMKVLRARLYEAQREARDTRVRRRARGRSAPATARSASAPTISRRGGSPTTASTSPSTSSTR